jgi:hypothetical protein
MNLLGSTPALASLPRAIPDEAAKSPADYNTISYLGQIRDLATGLGDKGIGCS